MARKKHTAEVEDFEGFTPEALEFLKKLKKNNKREWFQPRKEFFERQVQGPLKALLYAVQSRLAVVGLPLRVNSKAPAKRIYRDIRFSSDKTPYQTFVSGALHKSGDKKMPGALYIHVGATERFAALGFWQAERNLLNEWRLQIREHPKNFLEAAKRLEKKGLLLELSDSLQRMPRGFEAMAGTGVAKFLKLQSFVVSRQLAEDELGSSNLPDVIAKFAANGKVLLDYGWSLPAAKPQLFI